MMNLYNKKAKQAIVEIETPRCFYTACTGAITAIETYGTLKHFHCSPFFCPRLYKRYMCPVYFTDFFLFQFNVRYCIVLIVSTVYIYIYMYIVVYFVGLYWEFTC